VKDRLPQRMLIVSISMDRLLCSPLITPKGLEAADHTN
jgi:hypothetical protein